MSSCVPVAIRTFWLPMIVRSASPSTMTFRLAIKICIDNGGGRGQVEDFGSRIRWICVSLICTATVCS